MADASHLTGEELEELGGAEVVVPYGLIGTEVVLGVALVALLSFIGCGGLLMIRAKFGFPPWLNEQHAPLDELLAFFVVFGGYGCAWALGVWALVGSAVRAFGRSPGLVAGRRGVRAHGLWPWPRTLRWAEVEAIEARPRRLQLIAQGAPRFRPLGSPLLVPLPAGTDARALVATLWRLREDATGSPR